ncbi:MAG: hypothetical protein ACFFA7_12320 [Promethearchaeota archaeon]
MRKKTIILLVLVVALLNVVNFGIFSLPTAAKNTHELPEYIGVDWNSNLAGDVKMPVIDPTISMSERTGLSMSTPPVGTTVDDWYIGSVTGNSHMTLRAISTYAEIWVAEDLAFPAGDPRNSDPRNYLITDEMAEYLAEQFDLFIYENCINYFGAPYDRDGTYTIFELIGFPMSYWDWIETTDPYNPQRVILKILNIRDTNYYDPTYPYYTIGFYSITYTQQYYNRNMVHIDCWQWFDNLGPEGYEWYSDTEVTDPYTIEQATAHEYQHNIHRDWQPHPEAFMNEGCSMAAEFLCGYPYPWGYVPYFLATPDNSLVEWGDQTDDNIIADYAHSLLWCTYLADHFGAEFLTEYIQSGIPGIEGINTALDTLGYAESFNDLFHDWRIANLIHTDDPGNGRFNYKSIDLSEFLAGDFASEIPRVYEVGGRVVPWTWGSDFGHTVVYGGLFDLWDVINVGSYGTDYISFTDLRGVNEIWFEGEQFVVTPGWEVLNSFWYSGAQNLMNTLIATEVYVDPLDPFLYLTTYWDIEDFWDFGFVQVSEDGGKWDSTWTSLENIYTTYDHDPSAIIWAIENLPGLTSWSGFITPDGIVEMTFDLSAYAGQTIHLGFRYVTDWGTLYEGWYLLEGTVGGTEILSTLEHVYPPVNWMVSIVERMTLPTGDVSYIVNDIAMSDDGTWGLGVINVNHLEDIILVISPITDIGVADYRFRTYHPKFS